MSQIHMKAFRGILESDIGSKLEIFGCDADAEILAVYHQTPLHKFRTKKKISLIQHLNACIFPFT